jgi:hypothetical protein
MQLEMSLHAPSLTPYNSVDAILANWDSAKTLLTKIFENPGSKATPLDRVTLNQPINNPGDHIRMEVEGLGVLEKMVTEQN